MEFDNSTCLGDQPLGPAGFQPALKKTGAETTRAIIYARFSPRPRGSSDRSESIKTQLEICKRYCAEAGYEIVAEFSDKLVSGEHRGVDFSEIQEDRPGLWSCLKSIRRDWVLVALYRSRIARDSFLSEYIRRFLAKRGARIETVYGESIDNPSPEQQLLRSILDAVDEFERKIIGARTSISKRQKQLTGSRQSRFAPYGWKINGDGKRHPKTGCPCEMVKDDKEQEILKWIKEFMDCNSKWRDVARSLNEAGLMRRNGLPWKSNTVMQVGRKILAK